jgi:hypothetical protein
VTRIAQRYDSSVPVGTLSEHPANPRRGDVATIEESIRAHGFVGAVYAQESTGRIIAGNHRHRMAAQLGHATVPVIWLDVDEDQAVRLMLVLNRTEDRAGYDDRVLLEALLELGDLDGTTYTHGDVEDLQVLLDDGAWDSPPDPGEPDTGDPGSRDDGAPRISLSVPVEVFEAWTALLARYVGNGDDEKLEAHLRATGHLT